MASLDQIIDTILAHPRFSGQTFDAQTFIASLDEETLEQLFREIQEEEERERYSLFARMFPDEGPYRRTLSTAHGVVLSRCGLHGTAVHGREPCRQDTRRRL